MLIIDLLSVGGLCVSGLTSYWICQTVSVLNVL